MYAKIIDDTSHIPGQGTLSVCFTSPPVVSSNGIWEQFKNHNKKLLLHSTDLLPMLELQIFIIFFITMASHFTLKRLGLPLFISQVIVSVLMFIIIYIYIYCFY